MQEELKTYLFIIDHEGVTDSYIAVKTAYINKYIAVTTERIGRFGIIFTTKFSSEEIRDDLKMKEGEKYLLIELTGNITANAISGFFPDTKIEELRCLNLENLKNSAEWLQKELEKAVDSEDFEKAAKIRDKLKDVN